MKESTLITTLALAASACIAAPAWALPWSWTGTVAQWQAANGTGIVTDGDGDMAFKYVGSNLPLGTMVTLSEVELGAGNDFYDVGLDFAAAGLAGGFGGPGSLDYLMTVTAGLESLSSAELSITQTGAVLPQVTMSVTDASTNALIASLAVPPSPSSAQFSNRLAIAVHNDIQLLNSTGVVQDLHNSFNATVPEPGSFALAGVALMSLVLTRKSGKTQA